MLNDGTSVSLNDQIKSFLGGLLKSSVADIKQGFAPIASNLVVALLVAAPCVGIAVGGEFLAEKMSPAGAAHPGALALACGSIIVCQLGMMACFIGLLSTFVKVSRQSKVSFHEVLSGFNRIWSVLGAQLLLAPMFIVGAVLFVIPGFYLILRASMVPLVIADEGLGPVGAIKRSFELTKGREFEIGLLGAMFVISNYVVLAVSALAAMLHPVLGGLTMVLFLLAMQFVLTRYYVSVTPKNEIATKPADEKSEAPVEGTGIVCPA